MVWTNKRRLDDAAVEEVGEVVEVADVVALELEARAAAFAQLFNDALDILVGVAEDEVARGLEMLPLPVVLELLVAAQHREQAEVHRAHVERGHLGLGAQRRGEALFQAHAVAAAGRDVDHRLGRLLDPRQELHEHRRVRRRPAGLGVARVEVDDRGARLGRADRRLGDLGRRDRQMGRHGRRVDRAGHGTGDDHFLARCHPCLLLFCDVRTAGRLPAARCAGV